MLSAWVLWQLQIDQVASPVCSVKKATLPSRHSAPVVLLMVGTVGSGKSTFAGRLIQQGQAQWVRVNQVTKLMPSLVQLSCGALFQLS